MMVLRHFFTALRRRSNLARSGFRSMLMFPLHILTLSILNEIEKDSQNVVNKVCTLVKSDQVGKGVKVKLSELTTSLENRASRFVRTNVKPLMVKIPGVRHDTKVVVFDRANCDLSVMSAMGPAQIPLSDQDFTLSEQITNGADTVVARAYAEARNLESNANMVDSIDVEATYFTLDDVPAYASQALRRYIAKDYYD
ncbi:hypothetical protein DE146DRAFT_733243, partial [Phaeosphaeria sp. MPI-PUGE-AT-0046c]